MCRAGGRGAASRATFLAAPLTQVVQNFTQTHIADLMHTPKFHQLWININRKVHDQLLAALRGQTNVLHLQRCCHPQPDTGDRRGIAVRTAAPSRHAFSESQAPRSQRAAGAAAGSAEAFSGSGGVGPSNLGQINLFQSAQLATAQQLLRLLDVLTVLLPILTAGLILATLWISPDLRRTLLQLGLGIAVTFIIVKLATGYLNQNVWCLPPTTTPRHRVWCNPLSRLCWGASTP